MPDTVAVEEDALEPAPVEEPQVPLTTDRGDGVPLLVARDPAGRERRVVQEHDACTRPDGGGERVQVEPPVAPLRPGAGRAAVTAPTRRTRFSIPA